MKHHSIRKPLVLAVCGHTFCSDCLNKMINKKCPQCRKKYKEKIPNFAILTLIPESTYDYLKAEVLKLYFGLIQNL